MYLAFAVVLGYTASALLLSWGYFRRYQLARPPIGVFNLTDVAIMVAGIVVVPFLYLALPLWLTVSLLGLAVVGILTFTAQPVLRARWLVWLAIATLVGADSGIGLRWGTTSLPFLAVNDGLLALVVVGVANLWAQSGMRARDVAALAAMSAVYDVIATARLPLMNDLLSRLVTLPFAPEVAWRLPGGGPAMGIGLGDVLLAAVFPLVMRKAFGRSAGRVALALALFGIGAMLAVFGLAGARASFPAMAVLGPLMVAQYVYWVRRLGPERTTHQYLRAEPRRAVG